MTTGPPKAPDVVIAGGGVIGCATAYFLAAEHGLRVVVIERDGIASGASGGAAGELGAGGRHHFSEAYTRFLMRGIELHRELGPALREESGVDYLLGEIPLLRPAFDEAEADALREQMRWQREIGIEMEWLDAEAVRGLGTWLAPEAVGATATAELQLEAYPFALAVAQAAEHHGVEIRSGEVTDVLRDGDRAVGVRVGGEELAAGAVVIATGPWAVHAGAWMGIEVPVSPLRGQIVHLAPPEGTPMPSYGISHETAYVRPKAGGDLLAGTTQELAGFDRQPTAEAQDGIMEAVVRLAPALIDAPIRDLTACLRPSTPDGLPIIGAVDGWRDLYLSTGHQFKGVTLALVSGRSLAQLMTGETPDVALDDYSLARFAGAA
ncbi:MAG: FAD-binding oxidoreductase [Chloroflexi bacterium]|nr:FAD-binding oxidoreductase [Chloroflexota bacterium]